MPILNVVLWALLTGGVSGAVWMAIVLIQRQQRLAKEHAELLEDRQRTLDELDTMSKRLVEVEDRLDFAERRLSQTREPERLAPPRDGPTGGLAH